MSLDSFNAWMAANPEWLGMAIFLIAFLECAAIVGIVLPGVVLLFGVAVIAGSGALSLGETLMLAYAEGDGEAYGRAHAGPPLRSASRMASTPAPISPVSGPSGAEVISRWRVERASER